MRKYKAHCPDCTLGVTLTFYSAAERNEWINRHAEATMHNPEAIPDA